MAYDGFISYSHAADGLFAPRLQDGMQKLAKPWYRRRALNVFRDETGLAVNPNLWTSIVTALDDSEYFILLASPDAAASVWVGREIEHWVERNGPDQILPVLTDGEWVWDEAGGDFDRTASTAVPAALYGVFREEPRHLDLRWAKDEAQLDLRNGAFRDKVAEIAAPLHGLTKDDLEGADVRQHRRTRRLAASVAIMLGVLTFASIVGTVMAIRFAGHADAAAEEARVNEDKAVTNATEADNQRANAEASATEADTQRSSAERNAVEAGEQRQIAEVNATEANKEKALAETNAIEANRQKSNAEASAAEATKQQSAAEASAAEANLQRANAEANETEANLQRATAVANEAEANLQRATAVANEAEATRQRAIAENNFAIAEAQKLATDAANVALASSNQQLDSANTSLAETNAALQTSNTALDASNTQLSDTITQLETSNTNLNQRNSQLANANANSESARLAALSRIQAGTDPALAMLLARQAVAVAGDDNRPAAAALFAVLEEQASGIEQVRQVPDQLTFVGGSLLAASPDGEHIALAVASANLSSPRLYRFSRSDRAAPVSTVVLASVPNAIEVAADGSVLVTTAGFNGTSVVLIDPSGVTRYDSGEAIGTHGFLAADTTRAVVQAGTQIDVVDVPSGVTAATFDGKLLSALQADPFPEVTAARSIRSPSLLADGHRFVGYSTALAQWVVWDATDLGSLRLLGAPAAGALVLPTFDVDGHVAVVSTPAGLLVVDLATGAIRDTGLTATPGSHLAATRDGAQVLVAAPDGLLTVASAGVPGAAFSVAGSACLTRAEVSPEENWFVLLPVRFECGRSSAYLRPTYAEYLGPVPGLHLAFGAPPAGFGNPESKVFLAGDQGHFVQYGLDGSGVIAAEPDPTLDSGYRVDPRGADVVVPTGIPARLSVWPTTGGSPVALAGSYSALTFLPDGGLVTFDPAGGLVIWDVDDLDRGSEGPDLDGVPGQTSGPKAVSPGTTRTAAVIPGVDGDAVQVRDATTGAVVREIAIGPDRIVVRMRFLDEHRIAVAVMDAFFGTGVPTADLIVDTRSGFTTDQSFGLRGVSAGNQSAIAATDDRIVVFDTTSLGIIADLAMPYYGDIAAVSDDGRRLGLLDGTDVVVLDSVAGTELRRLTPGGLNIDSIALTGDGSQILVLTQDTGFTRVLTIFDVATGAVVLQVELPPSLAALGFANNDSLDLLAVTASGDRVFASGLLIDPRDGTILGQPLAGGGGTTSQTLGFARFTGDGSALVLVVDDRLRRYDIDVAVLAPLACSVAGRQLTPEEWGRYVGAIPYQPACA